MRFYNYKYNIDSEYIHVIFFANNISISITASAYGQSKVILSSQKNKIQDNTNEDGYDTVNTSIYKNKDLFKTINVQNMGFA